MWQEIIVLLVVIVSVLFIGLHYWRIFKRARSTEPCCSGDCSACVQPSGESKS